MVGGLRAQEPSPDVSVVAGMGEVCGGLENAADRGGADAVAEFERLALESPDVFAEVHHEVAACWVVQARRDARSHPGVQVAVADLETNRT